MSAGQDSVGAAAGGGPGPGSARDGASARVYLDHNATAPLREAARRAMADAMDVLGNPSSVHAEGRRARALVERARERVAEAFGAGDAEIVFTSGATEAAALALAGRGLHGAGIEHDAVRAWIVEDLPVDRNGRVEVADPGNSALQTANSETGVMQDLPDGLAVSDATQSFGKTPQAFAGLGVEMALVSSHKLGGPAGVGALVMRRGSEVAPRARGGGQEYGRRSGTENVIGIAGFGAAAEAAAADVAAGVWDRIAELRDTLEDALESGTGEIVFAGRGAARLPNTSCFALPGWKSETQVMQMDLAGFATSAGSACSSGKVKTSKALEAMGHDAAVAGGALRVSLGPSTQKEHVLRFAEAWLRQWKRSRA